MNQREEEERYVGKIAGVHSFKSYAFAWIDQKSITKVDGSPSGLVMKEGEDVFVHHADSGVSLSLSEGREIEFEVRPDERRGDGTFRAHKANYLSDSTLLGQLVNGGIVLDVQGIGEGRVLEHPSVFASWCFLGDLAERIRARVENGLVARLLVISGRVSEDGFVSRTVERQLVDINDPMIAVNFRSHGKNRVLMTVVFGESERALREKYLSKISSYCYSADIMSCGDLKFLSWVNLLGSGCVEVDVPEELFAKKPWDWEWTNNFFDSPPRDQCAFRKRRLFAYTIQPVLVAGTFAILGVGAVVSWLFSLCAVVLLLSVGMRGNYEPLWHPLRDKPSEVFDGVSNSVFASKIKGRSLPLLFVVSPLFLCTSAIVWSLWTRWPLAARISGGILICLAVILVSVTIANIISEPLHTLDGKWRSAYRFRIAERQSRLRREQQALYAQKIVDEVEALKCTHALERTPDINRLSMTPKNFRFYAKALKRKVCRGFAA